MFMGMPMPLVGGKSPPSFVGASAAYNGSSTTVPAPAGVQAGDLLVAFSYNTNGSRTLAPPDWNLISTATGSDGTGYAFWRFATSSDGTEYNLGAWSAFGGSVTMVAAYRNASAINAHSGVAVTARALSQSFSLTSMANGALVGFYAYEFQSGYATSPDGMTERASVTVNNPSGAVFDLTPSAAGPSGTKTLVTGVNVFMGGILLQIA